MVFSDDPFAEHLQMKCETVCALALHRAKDQFYQLQRLAYETLLFLLKLNYHQPNMRQKYGIYRCTGPLAW